MLWNKFIGGDNFHIADRIKVVFSNSNKIYLSGGSTTVVRNEISQSLLNIIPCYKKLKLNLFCFFKNIKKSSNSLFLFFQNCYL